MSRPRYASNQGGPNREGRAALDTYELNGSSVEPRYSGHFFDGFFPLTMAMTG